jgi:hypothetical protein
MVVRAAQFESLDRQQRMAVARQPASDRCSIATSRVSGDSTENGITAGCALAAACARAGRRN